MPTLTWSPSLPPIEMDPDDIRDFEFDFEAWLGVDTVDGGASSAFAEGCTAEVGSFTDTTIVLRVTGPGPGDDGRTGRATMRMVTTGGRQSDRSLKLRFVEQ